MLNCAAQLLQSEGPWSAEGPGGQAEQPNLGLAPAHNGQAFFPLAAPPSSPLLPPRPPPVPPPSLLAARRAAAGRALETVRPHQSHQSHLN